MFFFAIKQNFKMNGSTFRESNSAIFIFASSLSGCQLLKEGLYSPLEQSFSFKIRIHLESFVVMESKPVPDCSELTTSLVNVSLKFQT